MCNLLDAGLAGARASSITTTPACRSQPGAVGAGALKGLKPGDAGWPETAYNGDYIADIAADFAARRRPCRPTTAVHRLGDPDDLDGIRQFAVAYLRHEQDLDLQAFGVRFDHYYLEQPVHQRPRRGHRAAAGRLRQDLRGRRRAVAAHHRLRRRQGPRDAQVRRHLHLLRARRGLPHRQVRARLHQGHQRAGHRPPRHGGARARRPAGRRAWASRPATPTTCCTR
jgi:hypothetical protein